MSTYYGSEVFGDDILFGGGKLAQFGKFVKKQTKAASKTVARFDPTSKTAKYGNVTKGILAGAALIGATVLTGGIAAAAAGVVSSAGAAAGVSAGTAALLATGTSTAVGSAVVGAGIKAAKTTITPVRKPPKAITPKVTGVTGFSKPASSAKPASAVTQTSSTTTPLNSYTDKKPQSGLSALIPLAGVAALFLI